MSVATQKQQRFKRGENPNSRKNLKLFQKGKSGNPNGRPEGSKDRKSLLEYWLDKDGTLDNRILDTKGKAIGRRIPGLPEKIEGRLYDLITLGVIRKAMGGDVSAFKEIQDSIHGKQTDKTEHSGEVTVATRVIEPGG